MWRRCRRSFTSRSLPRAAVHTGRAIVRDLHTNVVLVEQDGVANLDKRDTDTAAAGDSDVVTPEQIASFLTVRSIWDYCTKELDPMNDPIDIIRSAVEGKLRHQQ